MAGIYDTPRSRFFGGDKSVSVGMSLLFFGTLFCRSPSTDPFSFLGPNMVPHPQNIMFYVLDVFVGALKYVQGGLLLWHALGSHLICIYIGFCFPR